MGSEAIIPDLRNGYIVVETIKALDKEEAYRFIDGRPFVWTEAYNDQTDIDWANPVSLNSRAFRRRGMKSSGLGYYTPFPSFSDSLAGAVHNDLGESIGHKTIGLPWNMIIGVLCCSGVALFNQIANGEV